jgi:outer membrane protein assembly factor BamD
LTIPLFSFNFLLNNKTLQERPMPFRIVFFCCLLALLAGCATTAPVNKPVETYFKQGEDLYQKKKYEDAVAQWKKAKESGSISPTLNAMADLRIADAQYENKSYIEAGAAYESFSKFHPNNPNAPYSLFRLALCYYNQITGIDTDQTPVTNAVLTLTSFLKQYPASEYAPEAREKLADCVIKQVQYEIYIGRFYLRFGKYQSSAKRLEECLARYPQAPNLDEALLYLEKAYFLRGEKEKGHLTFNRLLLRFPTSKHLKEAENLQKKHK